MSANESFGRDLHDWLLEDAEHRVPDHLVEALVRTAATRQRPWWSSPERWLPMTATTFGGRLAAPRPLLVLLLVATLVAALVGLAVFAGTNRPQPLVHSGLAGNGRIVAVTSTGALLSFASGGGDPQQLATIPGGARAISISPDGTRIAYKRSGPPAGMEIRRLSDQAIVDVGPALDDVQDQAPSWSPDGKVLAFVGVSGGLDRLILAATDGSPGLNLSPAGLDPAKAIWRPTFSPDGTVIAFVAFPPDQNDSGVLELMRTDGSGLRQLQTPPVSVGDAGGPDWAPDPARQLIAYETISAGALVTRLIDVATGIDHNAGPGFWPSWSPDGSQIATCCVQVATTAGILAGHVAQAQRFTPFGSYCNEYRDSAGMTVCSRATWSPDGNWLMATDITGGGVLIARADGSGGSPIRVPLEIGLDNPMGSYAWQPIWP